MPTSKDKPLIRINGEQLEGWSGFSIRRSFDRVSECAFGVTWDPANATLRRLFPPLATQDIAVSLSGGEELLTGRLVVSAPQSDGESKSLPLAGYGRPGVLERGFLEATKEFKKLRFSEIASQISSAFALDFTSEGDDGAVFDAVALEADKDPWDFLTKLGAERNRYLNDTAAGALRAWSPVEFGSPVMELEEGTPPLGPVGVTISDEWYSEVVGISGAKRGRGGTSHIEKNPFYTGDPKPLTFETKNTKPADLPRAVKAKLGRVIGNAMRWTIQLPGIRDPSGTLFRPNTTLTLLSPSAFIYRRTELMIRDVTFEIGEEASATELELVLPGAFGGELPSTLPWVA